MNAPFLICGYPRSRTAWLSIFLGCPHEATSTCKTPEELIKKLNERVIPGNSDSFQSLFIHKIIRAIPLAKIVIVQRSMEDALDSFVNVSGLEYPPCEALFRTIDMRLQLLSGPNVLRVAYSELSDEKIARQIWQHCRPDCAFNLQRFLDLDAMNIQQKPEIIRQAASNPNEFDLQPFLA